MANDYYKGNALYDYISNSNLKRFTFVTGNLWQLVYGDSNRNPKLLVLASGVQATEYGRTTNSEIKALNELKDLGNLCNIPVAFVQFKIDEPVIENVNYADSLNPIQFEEIDLENLKLKFAGYGLPVSDTTTNKYLNDRTSSAYHNWQRKALGRDLKVCDIDMWIYQGERLTGICELKRSKVKIENWAPYVDDYNNFQLLHNLVHPHLNFFIIYNVRVPNPFFDDVSRLKLFKVDFSKQPPMENRGILKIEDLIKE